MCHSYLQELRSREEELTRAALQQKSQEELLKRREQQLAEREIDVLERELNIMIFQLNQEKPNVKKRKGKFKRSRLKLKDGHRISLPSGLKFFLKFTIHVMIKYSDFSSMVNVFSIAHYFNSLPGPSILIMQKSMVELYSPFFFFPKETASTYDVLVE